MKTQTYKKSFIVTIILLFTFNASAGLWEEFNGRAAVERVKRSRQRVKAERKNVKDEKTKIAQTKSKITAAQSTIKKIKIDIVSLKARLKKKISIKLTQVESSMDRQKQLRQDLKALHVSTNKMRVAFESFREPVDKTVEGLLLSQSLGQYLLESETSILTFTRAYFNLKGFLPPEEKAALHSVVSNVVTKVTHPSTSLYETFVSANEEFLVQINSEKMEKLNQSLLTIESYAKEQISQVEVAINHYERAHSAYKKAMASL